jgi:two-component system NtrC family sensor kinase
MRSVEPQSRGPTPRTPLFRSLSTSLFLWLFGIVIVAFAAYALISYRSTAAQWEQVIRMEANRSSELIRRSTHYSMLLNHREDVHQIIRTVAQAPGVGNVRIYDKDGAIIYSAEAEEIGTEVDLRAEACVICHEQDVPLESVDSDERTRVFDRDGGERVLGLINPIYNAPECYEAACHAHPPDQSVLGVLDVTMSMADADASMASARRMVIAAAVLIALLVGASSAMFIYRVVQHPVKRLIAGTERIAHGDLDFEIEIGTANEIGQLARAFNVMTRDLRQARNEITEWSDTLERKVVEKTEELNRTQRQIVQMEKMASLGKLAATVAHELNNPLAGILTYAKLVERGLREGGEAADPQELERYLSVIQKESGRCGDIVRNLLLFARHSGAEFALHPLNKIIDRALMLVRHHIEIAAIQLDFRRLEGDDNVVCDSNQIQQALVALFVNAVEAMPNGGTMTVDAQGIDDSVRVTISDTGVGIPGEVFPNIFEPFFSTKDGANAVGLGLAVVYGIVRRHHGELDVRSEPGHGTEFVMLLPRRPAPIDHDEPNESPVSTGAGKAEP